jgi:hypothetical protein
MPLFDDILARRNNVYMDRYGEPAVYRPNGGDARSITIIVDRGAPQPIERGQKGHTYSMLISAENDSVLGISASEFDPGLDKIDLSIIEGGPLVTRNFSQEKFTHDGGMIIIKVV